jgi:hypothetical protein
MLIPCVNITITAQNHASATKTVPAYYAPMFRAVWQGRLDEKGVVVTPLPDEAPDNGRYQDHASVMSAELALVAYFVGGDVKREASVVDLFRKVFPDGLKDEIRKLLEEDAIRQRSEVKRKAIPMDPHKSFLEAGCTPAQALACQGRGWGTLREVPDDVVAVAEAVGNPLLATELIEKAKAGSVAPKVRQPV